ncbi:MAG: hypothetical protein GWM92_03540 [Gemmatimonadetes bacterium]|nr:hypothetical protein [Gemmatimonadota bacterium]NIR77593.1 hypothetical protein [Gemmatimonadota bacterium]NIT86148.1 hypothetical protein [Gemmatimonadota bacterium]NIU29962.1 hypothetical protein [Gemmatimonadota bacterium]NIU34927.1 hypothetical protein [Gemmatimonadota bacterium]
MRERDYILRMIEEMGEILIRIRKKILGQEEEAPVDADFGSLSRSLSRLAGVDLSLARSASADTLAMLVAPAGEVDPTRCWILAETLYLDGIHASMEGRDDDALASLDRAHRLFALVKPGGVYLVGFPEAAERMREIETRLEALGAALDEADRTDSEGNPGSADPGESREGEPG